MNHNKKEIKLHQLHIFWIKKFSLAKQFHTRIWLKSNLTMKNIWHDLLIDIKSAWNLVAIGYTSSQTDDTYYIMSNWIILLWEKMTKLNGKHVIKELMLYWENGFIFAPSLDLWIYILNDIKFKNAKINSLLTVISDDLVW